MPSADTAENPSEPSPETFDTPAAAEGASKAGGLLALLKYPFYPLFNFDNGMNLISKSLTILTSAQLLVVFAFAHIFWRYFIFAGFLPILEHEMMRPTIMR